ncbi:uncharacterized protein LOC126379264 [Pectinophora gossypiella]|uniref:uncharacterized protein LOC126379264 n=1 Tax=Pectinophora gossypiella TaxID=13191 RepID=UPI00214E95F7|nr:uncharacterized protein LOC126379264 [Pectinophora gossypiella]
MVFTRPSTIPLPTIWHRFSVTRGGVTHNLRVQDLTPEMREAAVQLLAKYFTRDEPPCKYIDINKYPTALAELTKLWWKTMEDNVSLVCVEDKEGGELVGCNVLTVACRGDDDEAFQTEDKVWAKLFGAVDAVSRGVNIFEKYRVEQYLTAYGLVVDPKWRGLSVGKEILRARVPLCKALGIKVTATVFTAGASQAVAAKAGFTTIFEISYEDLAKRGFIFPGIEEDTKSSKLMVLVVE